MPHPNQHAKMIQQASSFAECTLYGWLVSPYTAKVRAMLHYKRIPFTDVVPSAFYLQSTMSKAVGRIIMPTVKLQGSVLTDANPWRQDSALICDEIEKAHPEFPTRPSGPAQRMASSLLELHGDE